MANNWRINLVWGEREIWSSIHPMKAIKRDEKWRQSSHKLLPSWKNKTEWPMEMPSTKANPPPLGVGVLWLLLEFGISMIFLRKASERTHFVAKRTSKKVKLSQTAMKGIVSRLKISSFTIRSVPSPSFSKWNSKTNSIVRGRENHRKSDFGSSFRISANRKAWVFLSKAERNQLS